MRIYPFLPRSEGAFRGETRVFGTPSNLHGNEWGRDNDEAISLRLTNVPGGWTYELFDSPSRGTSDDFTLIRTSRRINDLIVNTFEQTQSTNGIVQNYHHVVGGNGRDGKVSSVTMAGPSGNLFL